METSRFVFGIYSRSFIETHKANANMSCLDILRTYFASLLEVTLKCVDMYIIVDMVVGAEETGAAGLQSDADGKPDGATDRANGVECSLR